MRAFRSVAIDGPAGAGKSVLARRAAGMLGYLYVDTGALYRTVALGVLRAGADPASPEQVVPLLAGMDVRMESAPAGEQRMFLNGEDVTGAIRTGRVSRASSQVSAIPEVRAFLLELQRQAAREHDVIMDGRDIGTVVLPDADVKIFLTASPEVRAGRRLRDLQERGERADYATVLREIRSRDARDAGRTSAPLRRAEDAVELDTTGMNLGESLQALLSIIEGKGAS